MKKMYCVKAYIDSTIQEYDVVGETKEYITVQVKSSTGKIVNNRLRKKSSYNYFYESKEEAIAQMLSLYLGRIRDATVYLRLVRTRLAEAKQKYGIDYALPGENIECES